MIKLVTLATRLPVSAKPRVVWSTPSRTPIQLGSAVDIAGENY